ncbi:MAG TPA: cytochrome c biogenesis protein CcsA [Cyclobacteriaceae bacterium]|nr:cytochrome c biogenesis protein CcsA [Cyclobacteriaceae bacterium]
MEKEKRYRLSWWKILTITLLYYSVIGGMLFPVPRLPIMNETIRLNYYHVPMWFTMMTLFSFSVWSSVRYLRFQEIKYDDHAIESAKVGFFFGLLGLLTGMMWANGTWGTFWTSDPKLNNTAIGLLIYSAYFVLRGSLDDETQRARLSAVYNIFAFSILIPLIFILPRMSDSLHPGSGNNPTFRLFDTAHNMKLVIYTAIIAFILLGWWFTTLLLSLRTLNKHQHEKI